LTHVSESTRYAVICEPFKHRGKSMGKISLRNASQQALDYTGERMVPEKAEWGTFWEHVYRYRFARQYVFGKDVLDIACGEGYGSAALAKAGASRVIGVDIDDTVCRHANRKYGIEAVCGSAESIPLPDKSVDVVVSFETIEHIPDPRLFLRECRRVLRSGGQLVISTPNKAVYSGKGQHNPFHCSELTESEFLGILREQFENIRLFSQCIRSAAWWSLRSFAKPRPWLSRVRGYYRLREMFPNLYWTHVAEESRADPIGLILRDDRLLSRLFNPYGIRPRDSGTREKPLYFLAVADVPR
jgi:2-polyprenyl-3-methyl-5-hydroxy-6-metoxy-1,4-benzoquinol methylase